MLPLKDLEEQLLHREEPRGPAAAAADGRKLLVLKQYRFHKKLEIQLFSAPVTREGKFKNPLTPIDPLEAVLQTEDPDELRFYAAVSRFQNNPTAPAVPADFAALQTVWENAAGFTVCVHDKDFSESIVAGSVRPVATGAGLHDLALLVAQADGFYDIRPQLTLEGAAVDLRAVHLLYGYFLRQGDRLFLPQSLQLVKALRFFLQYPAGMRLRPDDFGAFQKSILAKLEEQLSVVYTYARPLPRAEGDALGLYTPPERLIYLSELGSYVLINPVMKYGDSEVPLRSRKAVYATGAKGELYQLQRDDDAETNFLAMLLQQHPHFGEQLGEGLPYFYLHRRRFLDEGWFLEAFERWRSEGVGVLGFAALKGNKYNAHRPEVSVRLRSGINWFNALIGVRYGKQKASLAQVQRAVRNRSKYVTLDDGSLGLLPEDWVRQFDAWFAAAEPEGEELQLPRAAFKTLRELFAEETWDDDVRRSVHLYESTLLRSGAIPGYALPEGLQATLRPYQQRGYDWLRFLDEQNLGGCLADDMGLGKTVQAIALLLAQREAGREEPDLVVVPTSLLFNWEAELQRFAPSLRVGTLYGSTRVPLLKNMERYDVVLTTYGTLLTDRHWLEQQAFNIVLLDEAQQIKNPSSQRYEAVNRLKARVRFTLTGTPVENGTLDLYAQLSFSSPGLLGSPRAFRALFSVPIDQFKSSRRAAELQQRVAPFILRRTKAEVASELPEKTELVLHCPMGAEQRKAYDACEAEFRAFLEGSADEDVERNTLHVLRGLTRLRQICNSPLLLGGEHVGADASSKLDVLLEQLESIVPGHKVLVFSQFVSMLTLIKTALGQRGIGYAWLTGSTRDRGAAVKAFQEDASVRVFLISLKAGGTGLNLTEADYVFLVDPWWNPAVENQAIDRAYRIGQEKHVIATRLICPDTIEEKILQLQDTKRSLSGELVKSDGAFAASFSRSEWLQLLAH
ncbi:MAG: ATP-dependent helicase [Chitinophagaceae bacterium]|nr:MAG: ATP-dependent helicase [Chitinophagaceae bacterium]